MIPTSVRPLGTSEVRWCEILKSIARHWGCAVHARDRRPWIYLRISRGVAAQPPPVVHQLFRSWEEVDVDSVDSKISLSSATPSTALFLSSDISAQGSP